MRAICETNDGKIWVGFEKAGLGYYEPGSSGFYALDTHEANIGSPRIIFEDAGYN